MFMNLGSFIVYLGSCVYLMPSACDPCINIVGYNAFLHLFIDLSIVLSSTPANYNIRKCIFRSLLVFCRGASICVATNVLFFFFYLFYNFFYYPHQVIILCKTNILSVLPFQDIGANACPCRYKSLLVSFL